MAMLVGSSSWARATSRQQSFASARIDTEQQAAYKRTGHSKVQQSGPTLIATVPADTPLQVQRLRSTEARGICAAVEWFPHSRPSPVGLLGVRAPGTVRATQEGCGVC